jgi:hypothetical protein
LLPDVRDEHDGVVADEHVAQVQRPGRGHGVVVLFGLSVLVLVVSPVGGQTVSRVRR